MKIKKPLVAFVFTSLVLSAAFAINHIFPFGSKTVAWCDMVQQVIPLFCDLKDILEGNSGLFLNFKNAGGMNFYGVFFFFLSSPLSFTVKFVDKADIPLLMNVLVLVKLIIASVTASVAIERIFPKLSVGVVSLLSCCYACCGYGMLFYQNIMWLDEMYLFPLIALGCYLLITKSSPLLLTVSLTLSVIFNFYISFMVFLSVLFFFLFYTVIYRQKPSAIYPKLAASGIISLMISAVVTLPCLIQYFDSGRKSDSVIRNVASSDFFAHTETTLAVIICSSVVIATVIFAIPKLSSGDKTATLLISFFGIMCIPLFIEPVNMMWHTGSYMSFPARYGFITVFSGILFCGNELQKIQFAKKASLSVFSVLFSSSVIVSCLAYAFMFRNIADFSAYTASLWGNTVSIRKGLMLCLCFTVMALIVLLASKYLSKNNFAVILGILIISESLCNVGIYMGTVGDNLNLTEYRNYLNTAGSVSKDDGFYRVNMTSKIIDANMTGAAGCNSIAHYTSLNSGNSMLAAKNLGYSGYWMETGNWCGTLISDALMSVKYTVGYENNNYSSYVAEKNPCYLEPGVLVENDLPESFPKGDRITGTGELLSKITGCENPVTQYKPSNAGNSSFYLSKDGVYHIYSSQKNLEYTIPVTDTTLLYFDCYDGFSNRLNEPINNSFSVSVNGKEVITQYPTQRINGAVYLGRFSNETVKITVKINYSVQCYSFGVFGVNESVVANAVAGAKTMSLDFSPKGIDGTCDCKGQYFLNIPYEDNYRITVNGKKVNYRKAIDGYVLIDIPESGNFKLRFTPKGFTIGLIISISGLIFGLLLMLFKKKAADNQIIQSVTYGAFCGGAAMLAAAIYLLPISANFLYDIYK